MPRFPWPSLIIAIAVGVFMPGAGVWAAMWTDNFPVAKDELASTGRNPYFILEPGYTLVLEGGGGRLIVTVLNETKMVDGVKTRVVEERETKDGKLIEVSRNYFATSTRTNDMFYFGEEVDMYEGGKVVSHAGSWLSGVKQARFGLIMPAKPAVNAMYYQELAPEVAMDRAKILSVSDTVTTPAEEFTNCLKVEETSPLEPLTTEYKSYAPGVGLVQEGPLKLVRYGKAAASK
jgi:hypothetical protein